MEYDIKKKSKKKIVLTPNPERTMKFKKGKKLMTLKFKGSKKL